MALQLLMTLQCMMLSFTWDVLPASGIHNFRHRKIHTRSPKATVGVKCGLLGKKLSGSHTEEYSTGKAVLRGSSSCNSSTDVATT
jgi:hypothetical protein